jgi:hypothetical protein
VDVGDVVVIDNWNARHEWNLSVGVTLARLRSRTGRDADTEFIVRVESRGRGQPIDFTIPRRCLFRVLEDGSSPRFHVPWGSMYPPNIELRVPYGPSGTGAGAEEGTEEERAERAEHAANLSRVWVATGGASAASGSGFGARGRSLMELEIERTSVWRTQQHGKRTRHGSSSC